MVTRQTRAKGPRTRRRALESTPRFTPTASQERPFTTAELKTRLGMAGHRLQAAGLATRKLARSSMREVITAANDAREPMAALWRTFRLAGRHIVRDATAAWYELAPARSVSMKSSALRTARRAA